jgi:hypothetical protein
MKIESIEEIPGRDLSFPVAVPVVEAMGEGEASRVVVGPQIDVTSELVDVLRENEPDLGWLKTKYDVQIDLDLSDYRGWLGTTSGIEDALTGYRESIQVDAFRSVLGESVAPSSSLLSGLDLWEVNEIAPAQTGFSRVGLGRLGVREVAVTMPTETASYLEPGQAVLGPERLFSARKLFGFGQIDVDFVPDPEQPEPVSIWLPLVRVHCPHHSGCTATYSSETGTGEETAVTLSILGIGGGGGEKLIGSLGEEYTTPEGQCLELAVPAKLQMLIGRTVVDGTDVAYGMRGKVFDVDPNGTIERLVPAENDSCNRPLSMISQQAIVDALDRRNGAAQAATKTITLERELHGKVSVGLEVGGQVPLKFGIEYLRTASQKTTIKTALGRGAHYTAFAPNLEPGLRLEQQLEVCWTTQ